MRLSDFAFAFPAILSAIMLTAVFGPGMVNAIIAIGIYNIPTFARITRAAANAVWGREFVLAARACGKGRFAITMEHVLPNVLGPVVVYVTLTIPTVILAESFLSFLGLGIQDPLTSWGVLIADGKDHMETAPWMLIFPALFMAVTLFCFNFIGDGLRDALDPKDR